MLATLAALAASAAASAAPDVRMTSTGLDRIIVRLQPGQTREFSLNFANIGDTRSTTVTFRTRSNWAGPTSGRPVFQSRDSARCSDPTLRGYSYEFDVMPLNPGDSMTCRFQVTRPASSTWDEDMEWPDRPLYQNTTSAALVKIGTPVDLRFDSSIERFERRADGVFGTVRVRASNLSDTSLIRVGIFLCNSDVPFRIERPMMGGCAPVTDSPASPLIVTDCGSPHTSIIGDIPAHTTKSCLLNLVAPAGTPTPQSASAIVGDHYITENLGVVTHVSFGNSIDLTLGAPPPQVVPVVSGVRFWTLLAAAALLLGLAALRARR